MGFSQAPGLPYSKLGIPEDGDTASQAISKGKYVIWKGKNYFAKTDILQGETFVEDTNLTEIPDGALNGIVDTLGASSTYSTNEQVVGKWIDGKSIYRKVISGLTFATNTTNSISTGITDATKILKAYGSLNQEGLFERVSGLPVFYIDYFRYSSGELIVYNGNNPCQSGTGWVALEYIK